MSAHLNWRHEIKERVRGVFQTLRSAKEICMGSDDYPRKWVRFESKDECDFMFNLVYAVFKATHYKFWTCCPVDTRGFYTLFLINKFSDTLTNEIIDRLVLEVDVFFNHMWQYAILRDSTILDISSRAITASKWDSFLQCVRAYAYPEFAPSGLLLNDEIVNLYVAIPNVDVRRMVCPLIVDASIS